MYCSMIVKFKFGKNNRSFLYGDIHRFIQVLFNLVSILKGLFLLPLSIAIKDNEATRERKELLVYRRS